MSTAPPVASADRGRWSPLLSLVPPIAGVLKLQYHLEDMKENRIKTVNPFWVLPGRGRVCDEYEVSEYRDMLASIRDRVQAMIGKGATLELVKAARVTVDYDDRYGATSGPWTTDMFVEAVYTSLKRK